MKDPRDITLHDLITSWYGPPVRAAIPLPDTCDWLPAPLKHWHTLASRWDARLTRMTSMVPPEKIQVADDGKAVFMVDATGDWRWSFDPADPGTVHDAELYEPWQRNPEPFTQFLIHTATRELVHSVPHRLWTSAAPDAAVAEILSPLEEIGFGAWQWPTPGHRIFTGDDTLVQVVAADGGWQVEVAAREPTALTRLESIATITWHRPTR
ncbi:hypothetical protein [Asanoa siamensis]|uniref:hypothetical protein n=1 Tax=Asanoa siamensis TaxID=926357 RepID=UPI001944469A|nr:hypothetical protein [Asanoa siamensis]